MLAHLLAGAERRARAGDRAARGRRQLDRRGRALHPDAAGQRAPRREPRRARRDRGAGRGADRRRHDLRHRGARRRGARRDRVGARWCSTRRRRSRTRRTTRRSNCAASRRGHASRSPARRSRTASATSGRSSTSSTRASSATGRSSSPGLSSDGSAARVEAEDAMRALNGILVFRRTKAEPEIADELPDQIDELDHCAMTPEQIGLYQAVLDKLVTGTDAARGRGAAQGPDPRRDHRAQADLQPPVRVPARRPSARRAFGQARAARGDRRRGVRGRRAGAGLHALRGVGHPARRAPLDAHRHRRRVLPRRPGAHRARPAHRRLPGAATGRARWCCR